MDSSKDSLRLFTNADFARALADVWREPPAPRVHWTKLKPRLVQPTAPPRKLLGTCAVEYARLYELMRDANAGPRVRAGVESILRYLNELPPEGLGLRDLAGKPITWRRVRLWFRKYGFPLLPGLWRGACERYPKGLRYRAVTLERAIDAWMLSRPHNHTYELFVVQPRELTPVNGWTRGGPQNPKPAWPPS